MNEDILKTAPSSEEEEQEIIERFFANERDISKNLDNLNDFLNKEYGIPKTEEERKKRHKEKFGINELPPRGTGLHLEYKTKHEYEGDLDKYLSKSKVDKDKAKKIGDKLGINWDEIDLDQFTQGINVEFEHKDVTGGDLEETGKIALAHIKEVPDYYTKLLEYVEKQDDIRDKIIQFFIDNPDPEDDEVHTFAEELDMSPEELEEEIYSIISDEFGDDNIEKQQPSHAGKIFNPSTHRWRKPVEGNLRNTAFSKYPVYKPAGPGGSAALITHPPKEIRRARYQLLRQLGAPPGQANRGADLRPYRFKEKVKYYEENPIQKTIVKVGDEYQLRSKHTGKVLGTHPSREAAMKQEAAIKISQHKALDDFNDYINKGGPGSGRKPGEQHVTGVKPRYIPGPKTEEKLKGIRNKRTKKPSYEEPDDSYAPDASMSLDVLNKFLDEQKASPEEIASHIAREKGYGEEKEKEIAEKIDEQHDK